MRIGRTLLGIAMIALVTAGCGGSGSHDNASRPADTAPPKSGKELPIAITSAEPGLLTVKTLLCALPPEPTDDAAFTERVLWTMRKHTVAMAGIPGRTSAACEGGKVSEKPGVTTRCTVTYNGVKVPWSIRFEEPAGDLKPYEITNAGQTVLTAKSVYGEFWREYNRVSKHLRCGKVPDLELVAYGQDTGHRCQYASSNDGKARWVNVPVSVGERGVIFDNGRSPESP
ncbi:hypothetical protein OHU11_01140 [Streptomyces sp. NBC_00257]|uniref:hypothetical protein n=1 Tax=unclassified Streptomyces TaxID=2593676 RepID=UPI002252D141|nr:MULTISPECIES: hypothetical protein [unclassified Streptomyces]MCX5426362.1 hypothetical protein [Streptomyces sp. NBC_00062]